MSFACYVTVYWSFATYWIRLWNNRAIMWENHIITTKATMHNKIDNAFLLITALYWLYSIQCCSIFLEIISLRSSGKNYIFKKMFEWMKLRLNMRLRFEISCAFYCVPIATSETKHRIIFPYAISNFTCMRGYGQCTENHMKLWCQAIKKNWCDLTVEWHMQIRISWRWLITQRLFMNLLYRLSCYNQRIVIYPSWAQRQCVLIK